MTKINEIYKCDICGNIVEVLNSGAGELVCCGQPMTLQKEKSKDIGQEKHVPIIEKDTIKVGSIPHPMDKEHYIQWIESTTDDLECKKFLKPGDVPEMKAKAKKSRAYCNIHGLWKS